jgi:aryl carrier-like protein
MTPAEIAELFGEIIEIDDVAGDENFFQIGGNSFLALTLIARLRQQGRVELKLIDIVHTPTPEGLARVMADRMAGPPAGAAQ